METKKHPEWKVLYDYYRDVEFDTIIRYDDMNKLIRGDVRGKEKAQLQRFRKELLRGSNRALENIPNKGYRVVNPNEHVRLTGREIRRAQRRVRKGAEIILHVDYERLSEKEKGQANLIASRVQNLAAVLIGEDKAVKELTVHYRLPELPRR